MPGACGEAVTTGLQRKRTTQRILIDPLRAETAHYHVAWIRYRVTVAKLPKVKDLDTFVFEGTTINKSLGRKFPTPPAARNARQASTYKLNPSACL